MEEQNNNINETPVMMSEESVATEAPKQKADGKAIAGLVLSILAIVFFFVGFATFWTWLVGLVVAIVGIVMSAMGLKSGQSKGMATAGLIMSIIALVLNVILFAACGVGMLVLLAAAEAAV